MEPSDHIPERGRRWSACAPLDADVGRSRSANCQRRRLTIAVILAVPRTCGCGSDRSRRRPDEPRCPPSSTLSCSLSGFFLRRSPLAPFLGTTIVADDPSRDPYRPDQIGIDFRRRRGIDAVKGEAVRSLNLFLAHRSSAEQMGGPLGAARCSKGRPEPARPGAAKGHGRRGRRPSCSSAPPPSSPCTTAPRRARSARISAFCARPRAGVAVRFGFMEEIDAIATARGGVNAAAPSEAPACGGMQGLPAARPAGPERLHGQRGDRRRGQRIVGADAIRRAQWVAVVRRPVVDNINLLLPAHRQIRRPRAHPTNVMLIAATNRASALDPALMRQGRFDRS